MALTPKVKDELARVPVNQDSAQSAEVAAILRFAGGRELTLGDLGAEKGLLGGINAIIVGNYLTTLGRPQETDVDMLNRLHLPIKALNATV